MRRWSERSRQGVLCKRYRCLAINIRVSQTRKQNANLACLCNTSMSGQSLALNSLSTFSGSSINSTAVFTLPASVLLTVSIAICSLQASSTRFFLTNDTAISLPGPEGGIDVFEISLENGYGHWAGPAANGGFLAIDGLDQGIFEVAVSDNGTLDKSILVISMPSQQIDTIHEVLDTLPLFGDTTANQALLFSPPVSTDATPQPTYPNYTLPSANPSIPDAPISPSFDLVLAPLSAQLTSLPQTGCSLTNISSSGTVKLNDLWYRGSDEWRSQWLIDGLSSSTNYTAYVIQDHIKVSGPIYFVTKSGTCFSISLGTN